jgi:hypothetical protein
MKRSTIFAALAFAFIASGCQRIETGKVGVRVGWDKQVKPGELLPGSFNQTLFGDVLAFPVKDISVGVNDMTPIAKDNSTMKDFDISVIYSINPNQVSELWVSKNRSFHATEEDGDILLMYNYVGQLARNAAYKAAREYEALLMNDNRQTMEQEIKNIVNSSLREEKLDGAITISQVLIRSILPADTVVASANALVRAKNELEQKKVEVATARQEAARIEALNANKGAVEYMNAMANVTIAEAIRAGKVNTIIIPSNLTMLGNVGK